jgi:hypothetical protein
MNNKKKEGFAEKMYFSSIIVFVFFSVNIFFYYHIIDSKIELSVTRGD